MIGVLSCLGVGCLVLFLESILSSGTLVLLIRSGEVRGSAEPFPSAEEEDGVDDEVLDLSRRRTSLNPFPTC